jgi:hypothetical protein
MVPHRDVVAVFVPGLVAPTFRPRVHRPVRVLQEVRAEQRGECAGQRRGPNQAAQLRDVDENFPAGFCGQLWVVQVSGGEVALAAPLVQLLVEPLAELGHVQLEAACRDELLDLLIV